MAINAKIGLSTSVKVTEGTNQIITRSTSGSIDISEYVTYNDVLPANTSLKEYNFNELDSLDFVSIESDGDIDVIFNGNDPLENTVFELKKKIGEGASAYAMLMMSAEGLTSLYITNPSQETPAKIKVIFGKYGSN